MAADNHSEKEVTFKGLFVPFATKKAIVWIILIGLIVYFNSLFGKFLVDETIQIVKNPTMHAVNNIASFFIKPEAVGAEKSLYYYRPIPYSIYAIFFTLFGQSTFFYHLFQLSLHITTSIFVFILFKKFFKKNIAFFLSLIFLVHPMNVEVVSWITYLQDTLYVFFGMLGLFLFLMKKNTLTHSVSICILLTLSLFSKETGALFILMILFCQFLFDKKNLFKLYNLFYIVPLGIYGLVRFIIAKNYYISTKLNPAILIGNLLTLPKMVFYYLKTFLFPLELASPQQWFVTGATTKDFYFPLLVDIIFALLVFVLGFYMWKNKREQFSTYIFFLVWFILGLVPHLELWLLDMTVADRWFYFAIIGLLGLLGTLINSIKFSNKKLQKIFYIVSAFLIFILSFRTVIRNMNFQDNLTLLKHDAPIVHNFTAEKLLVNEYIREGNYEDAKKELPSLVQFAPNNPLVWEYESIILYETKDYLHAKYFLNKLLHTQYDLLSYQILPQILINNEQNYVLSEKLLKDGTRKYPKNTQLWEMLTFVEFKLGNNSQAENAVQHTTKNLREIINSLQ